MLAKHETVEPILIAQQHPLMFDWAKHNYVTVDINDLSGHVAQIAKHSKGVAKRNETELFETVLSASTTKGRQL